MMTKMTQSVFAAALMYMVKEEISDSVVSAAASLRTWRRGGRRGRARRLPPAPQRLRRRAPSHFQSIHTHKYGTNVF